MNEGAMQWDSVIENDSQFVILPAGEYQFRVDQVEKSQFDGSAKLSPCPKAIVHMTVWGNGQEAQVKENLLLHSKMEWKICQFFTALGLRKSGEKLQMAWNRVGGATGTLVLKIEKYTNKNGEQAETNRVDKFLEPKAGTPAPQQAQAQETWEVPAPEGDMPF